MDREVILDRLKSSDMVLVGIGEVFDGTKRLQQSERYLAGCEMLREADLAWMLPGWREYCLKRLHDDTIDRALESLKNLLEGKNYFAVSVATNRIIDRKLRAVMPCGSVRRKQCPDGCGGRLPEVTAREEERLEEAFFALWEGHRPRDEHWLGVCEQCGGAYVFNTIYSEYYDENGYLEQWKLYMKWLEGTLHHKLFILELGVGMKFPSVVRWPFERTAFLNQKAFLCRVNENLYHLTPETAQKGCGISEDAVDWIARL